MLKYLKQLAGKQLAGKTLNSETLRNSSGRVRVVKKKVRFGSGSGYSSRPGCDAFVTHVRIFHTGVQ